VLPIYTYTEYIKLYTCMYIYIGICIHIYMHTYINSGFVPSSYRYNSWGINQWLKTLVETLFRLMALGLIVLVSRTLVWAYWTLLEQNETDIIHLQQVAKIPNTKLQQIERVRAASRFQSFKRISIISWNTNLLHACISCAGVSLAGGRLWRKRQECSDWAWSGI